MFTWSDIRNRLTSGLASRFSSGRDGKDIGPRGRRPKALDSFPDGLVVPPEALERVHASVSNHCFHARRMRSDQRRYIRAKFGNFAVFSGQGLSRSLRALGRGFDRHAASVGLPGLGLRD